MSESVRIQPVEPLFGHGRPLSSPLAGEVAAQRSMGGEAAGCGTVDGSLRFGHADSPPSRPSPIKGEGEFGLSRRIGSRVRLPDPTSGRAS